MGVKKKVAPIGIETIGWYKKGDVVLNGNYVEKWINSSGELLDAVQNNTLNQPLYWNGRLIFKGEQFMNINLCSYSTYTIFALFKPYTTIAGGCVIAKSNHVNSTHASMDIFINGATQGSVFADFGNGVDARFDYTDPPILVANQDIVITVSHKNGEAFSKIYKNGILVPTTGAGTCNSSVHEAMLAIGKYGSYNGAYFQGEIEEIIVTNTEVSEENILNISNYLNYRTEEERSYNIVDVSNNTIPWMDGLGVASVDGKIRIFGGWNPAEFPAPPTTNQQFETVDGVTINQLADAPWTKRHSFGFDTSNNKIQMCGGDSFGGYLRDFWTYNTAAGWVRTIENMSNVFGDRVLFSTCIHKGYFYVVGGQLNYQTGNNYTDVIRTNDYGATWIKVGDLPITQTSAACLISDGENLMFMGGGDYGSAPFNYNDKILKSVDDGVTWITSFTISEEMKSIYPNGVFWDERYFYIKGAADVNSGSVYYSDDGIKWEKIGMFPPFSSSLAISHARGVVVHNDELYCLFGNVNTKIQKISKVNV